MTCRNHYKISADLENAEQCRLGLIDCTILTISILIENLLCNYFWSTEHVTKVYYYQGNIWN